MKKIIIGARGSQLSLIQTHIVKDLLHAILPQTIIEITTIKTSGDKNMSPIPLDTIGKGWFTKEIDRQLLEGKIDIAVHSLKDLLDTLTPGLAITAIPEREDASEALVSRNGETFAALKQGAIIGTDSIRRKIQILKKRPDLVVKSVRGNVNRRLEKLDAGEYDALILATAGLKRLGLQKRITQYFNPTEFIPSPGQGTLAVVTRQDNKTLNNILEKLNHSQSIIAITAERAFSRALGGGCSMPVGAYAEIGNNTLTLYGMLGSEDETHMVKGAIKGHVNNPEDVAKKLADQLAQQANSWYRSKKPTYVILTRERKENNTLATYIKTLGLQPLVCPSITVSKNLSRNDFQTYLAQSAPYEWIIFTSSNGVEYFVEGLKDAGKDMAIFQHSSIAVVGEKTAQTAKKYGISVSLIPKEFTAESLVKALPNLKNKHILLPQSTIANAKIQKQLKQEGAFVTAMPVYQTKYTKFPTAELERLVQAHHTVCLTFTSPSTVGGFLKNIQKKFLNKILSLPVISIGPVTTAAAKKYGFTNIYTAQPHTTEGICTKLAEIGV